MKLPRLSIVVCPQVNKDHRRSKRQYAHTLHRPGQICVADAFWELPPSHLYAILAHEVGHILADSVGLESTEEEADDAANTAFGIQIKYRSTRHGEWLEYLTGEDVDRFLDLYEIG